MSGKNAIVELRQYRLHPCRRDELIQLFEREFIEPQEHAGMRILGQFRSLDDDDRFVWMRGFPDMSTRANALATFYGGPAWQAHKAAANATMIDSDDVLLLHPAHPNAGFAVRRGRTGAASGERPRLYVASVHTFEAAVEAKFALHFDTVLAPLVARYGGNIVARLATERSRNTYPALPVRENENAFVWLANFADAAAYDRYLDCLRREGSWQRGLDSFSGPRLGPITTLRLEPTARSLLR